MKKRGASHVEMILAFVIFLSFVIFLIYFLKPFGSNVLEDSTLISAKDKFFENNSVELVIVLVNSSSDCKPSNIPETTNMNSKKMPVSPPKEGIFYIYFSEGITDDSLADCPSGVKLGSVERVEVLSSSKLENFKNRFNSDYASLKLDLGLPVGIDFSVLSNDYILEKTSPENVKVIAGAYRKQILSPDGTLINKDFIIKVW